jgi:hypothetical protein
VVVVEQVLLDQTGQLQILLPAQFTPAQVEQDYL